MLDRPHCHRTPKSRASNDRFARPLQGRSEPLGAQTAAKSRQPLSSSPAFRTGADKQERSRDALRPSLANANPKTFCLHIKKGGGAPIGARVESAPALRMSTSEPAASAASRSEEHTSELQSPVHLVCRLLLEKKKNTNTHTTIRH